VAFLAVAGNTASTITETGTAVAVGNKIASAGTGAAKAGVGSAAGAGSAAAGAGTGGAAKAGVGSAGAGSGGAAKAGAAAKAGTDAITGSKTAIAAKSFLASTGATIVNMSIPFITGVALGAASYGVYRYITRIKEEKDNGANLTSTMPRDEIDHSAEQAAEEYVA